MNNKRDDFDDMDCTKLTLGQKRDIITNEFYRLDISPISETIIEDVLRKSMAILKINQDEDETGAIIEGVNKHWKFLMYGIYIQYLKLYGKNIDNGDDYIATPLSEKEYFEVGLYKKRSVYTKIQKIKELGIFDNLKNGNTIIIKLKKYIEDESNVHGFKVLGITRNGMLRTKRLKDEKQINKISPFDSDIEIEIFNSN